MVELGISCEKREASKTKAFLSKKGILDKKRNIIKQDDFIIFPILSLPPVSDLPIGCHVVESTSFVFPNSASLASKQHTPRSLIKKALLSIEIDACDDELPKWEKYDGFLLFPEHAFTSPFWLDIFAHRTNADVRLIFKAIAIVFKVDRVARKTRISTTDILRRPHIDWLYISGTREIDYAAIFKHNISEHLYKKSTKPSFSIQNNSGEIHDNSSEWFTSIKQNGITYIWNPSHSMFSPGNITEKTRVIRWLYPKYTNKYITQDKNLGRRFDKYGVENEVVLDLYAGIGYFTLAYLASGRVKCVIACEWNKYSVEGLKMGIQKNGYSFTLLPNGLVESNDDGSRLNDFNDKHVYICEGNNETYVKFYQNKLDRVSLGLIPSSSQGYPLAVQALKSTGGWMHIHINILEQTKLELKRHDEDLVDELKQMFRKRRKESWHVVICGRESVKSFRPRVWHWVYDVYAFPSEV